MYASGWVFQAYLTPDNTIKLWIISLGGTHEPQKIFQGQTFKDNCSECWLTKMWINTNPTKIAPEIRRPQVVSVQHGKLVSPYHWARGRQSSTKENETTGVANLSNIGNLNIWSELNLMLQWDSHGYFKAKANSTKLEAHVEPQNLFFVLISFRKRRKILEPPQNIIPQSVPQGI